MLIIHILVQDPAMIGESREVPEHVAAVLTLVYLVPPVSLYVCPEVVPTCVPSPADVTGKRFLPRMDPHVSTKVRRPNELSTAHLTRIGALRLWDRFAVAILLWWLVDDTHGGIPGRSRGGRCCELVDGHDGRLQQGEVPTDVL
jgi:hypothetical protein